LEFDFVVVALRGGFHIPAIKMILNEQGVENERIICVLERILPLNSVDYSNGDSITLNLAVNFSGISFAIFMTGGFGDMVTYKRMLEELHRLVPTAKIDIFTVRGLDFLQWLYSEEDYINGIYPDLGKNYNENKEKYSLGLSFMESGLLNVDFVRDSDFENYEQFLSQIKALDSKRRSENFNLSIPIAVMFYRRIFNGENCYTGFNYGDVFSIKDIQIKIPSPKKYIEQFEKIGLKDYITINTGNGTSKEALPIAKSWPAERFQKVANMFKQKYPNIKIVQIGLPDEPKIDGIDEYVMGESFGLVAEILRNAIFHLDIEGGLVHLASQIGTKCIVLFGPTLTEYNAYENNINIRVGDCHGCYGLYLNTSQCARYMKEPECMYNITPEIVMKYIDKYLRVI